MPVTIYLRGNTWHYRGTVAGRRLRGSTETSDKTTAERIAAETEAKAWRSHLDGPESVFTFSQAATLYLDAQKTATYIDVVSAHWKDELVKNINSGLVRQAAISRFPTHSNATRNRHFIAPTQAVINHAAELELCHHLRVKKLKAVSARKIPTTWAWIQDFVKAADTPHQAAFAYFLFLTGARPGEAVKVRWKDVDLAAATVRIVQFKVGGDVRVSHMPAVLVKAIDALPSNREDDEWVFKYNYPMAAQRPWNLTIKRAGIKHLSFYSCRHGFATGLLRSGIDPVTVAKLGGWKSIKHVVETYGHAQDDPTLTDRLVPTDTALTQPIEAAPETEAETVT